MKGVLIGLLLLPALASAQCDSAVFKTWIEFSDFESCIDTLWFGHDPTGSYGLDVDLCEIELPPPPPVGVCDVRFVNIPGREGMDTPAGLGQGVRQDYREFVYGIDTFRIRFQPGNGVYPVRFRWSALGIIYAHLDSALLLDEFGGILYKVRMNLVDSLVISNPAINSLLLLAYTTVIDSHEGDAKLPTSFGVSPNYPNPFNAATTIRYAIPAGASGGVSLQVFDLLGRHVATLVDEEKEPGRYSIQWDATDFPSGVYFYRLRAGEFVQTRSMVLMK